MDDFPVPGRVCMTVAGNVAKDFVRIRTTTVPFQMRSNDTAGGITRIITWPHPSRRPRRAFIIEEKQDKHESDSLFSSARMKLPPDGEAEGIPII